MNEKMENSEVEKDIQPETPVDPEPQPEPAAEEETEGTVAEWTAAL